MAAHPKLDRRRVYLGAGGLRKRGSLTFFAVNQSKNSVPHRKEDDSAVVRILLFYG